MIGKHFVFALTAFTIKTFILSDCVPALSADDPYESYDSWRRFKVAEFALCKNYSRLSFFEISTGSLKYKFGKGLGFVDLNRIDNGGGEIKEAFTVSVLPFSIYMAFPLGKVPRSDQNESGEGRIIVVPKQGFFQYPACLYVNSRTSIFSMASFDGKKEYAVTFGLSVGFEKSLWYQSFAACEAGFYGFLCPVTDEKDFAVYAGISVGMLSNWKRVDI
ncbi:hypothetical protein JXL83_08140 [candidate division WOR-3 bacterium]|nr:hypothetical protein [candidate division WOR-3 bacterium]